jgi:ATP-dependent Lon protease
MSNPVIARLIDGYTREAGVRALERQLARLTRKAAVEILDTSVKAVSITSQKLREYLGAPRYTREDLEKENLIGIVNGLAVTSVGGETLAVECSIMQGNGTLQLTGKLGDVMQESAKAALSWVRTHAESWGIPMDFFKEHDIHFHVPEGAVPKDGPSAGIAMTTALTSALLSIPVRQDVAMTGEITLRGRVLPIGGLKEKLLAANRANLKEVLIPKGNAKDLETVPNTVLKKLRIIQVEQMTEVLPYALTAMPLGKPILSEFAALSAQLPKGERISYPRV